MQARFLLLLASCLTAVATPAAAKARAVPLPFVPMGSQIQAPRGYQEMCASHPEWCGTGQGAEALSNGAQDAPFPPVTYASFDTVPDLTDIYRQSVAGPSGPMDFRVKLDTNPLAQTGGSSLLRSDPEEGRAWLGSTGMVRMQAHGLPDLAPLLLGVNVALHSFDIGLYRGAASIGAELVAANSDARLSSGAATGGIELSVQASRSIKHDRSVSPDLAMLQMINRKVNGRVAQRRDTVIFGQGELWRRSGTGRDAVGDCEDLAIEKRLQLVAEGFPAERLAYAVVYDRRLGLHTILVARTDKGDMVLDSATPYISAWHKTGYSWISIQAMDNPQRWLSVNRGQTV